MIDSVELQNLQEKANNIRKNILDVVYNAASGHPGGSLSIADVLSVLYFKELNVDVNNPKNENRDRVVLSKGHCCTALYGALAERGYFDKAELKNFRKVGAMLQGHPDMKGTPGVEMSTGSLGQGFSVACGMAMASKLDNAPWRVYALLGDGECQEGIIWEAAMSAAHYKLDNLVAIVDNNNLQIDGTIEEVNSPYPIPEKFSAFGWNVIEIDAHNFDEIEDAFKKARECKGKPTAIVQKSTKGKGVSFMEDQCSWHGAAPNEEQYNQAMAELQAALAELEA